MKRFIFIICLVFLGIIGIKAKLTAKVKEQLKGK